MLIEHIAKGRYILDLGEREERDVTHIALGFYKSNRSNCLRKMLEAGIAVYKDLIAQGCENDQQFRDSLKIVSDHLIGESTEFDQDIKFGSAIDGRDNQETD